MAWVFGVPEASRDKSRPWCLKKSWEITKGRHSWSNFQAWCFLTSGVYRINLTPRKNMNPMYLLDWVPIRIPRDFFVSENDYAHEMSQKSPTWDLFVELKVTQNTLHIFCVFVLNYFSGWWGLKKSKALSLGGGSKQKLVSPRTLGKWSYLTSIFVQMGWFNHQVAMITLEKTIICVGFKGWRFMKLGWFFSCLCC